jgi:hypothetical protein
MVQILTNRVLLVGLLVIFTLSFGVVSGMDWERRRTHTVRPIYLRAIGALLGVVVFALAIAAIRMEHTKSHFPFRVSYRKALTGSGYVAQIRNISRGSQSVKVTLENPTLNRARVYSLVVDARDFREIGYLQGWTLASGDKITLECNGDVEFFSIP